MNENEDMLLSMRSYWLQKLTSHVSGLLAEEKDYPTYNELLTKCEVDLSYLIHIQGDIDDLHNSN